MILNDSELNFCRVYHLSSDKNLDDIANTLMWTAGKVLATKKLCEDKGHIVDGEVTQLALSNIRTIIGIEVKELK